MGIRLALVVVALLAASTAAAWFPRGSVPQYPSWKEVAQSWPCNKIQKDGKDVKIIGPLVVDGKSYEQHVIKDQKLVKIVDERCHMRLDE